MSIFSLPTLLISPQFHYGLWYSYNHVQPGGYMLTLGNFTATYLTLALGMLIGWAISRLWLIVCAILFYFSYQPDPSWEESQNNVFIVTSKNALDAIFDSYEILTSRAKAYRRDQMHGRHKLPQGNIPQRQRKARNVVISTMLAGIIIVGLKLSAPLFISLIPISKLGVVVSRSCGNGSTPKPYQYPINSQNTKWISAALATVDRSTTDQLLNISDSLLETEKTALPKPKQSFNYTCSLSTSSCSTRHPFSFSSEYTLSTKHFGLNVGISFSLTISESCYRPPSTISNVDPTQSCSAADTYPSYNVNDSTGNTTIAFENTCIRPHTYTIYSQPLFDWLNNPGFNGPTNRTLLVYHVGPVDMTAASSDPIFCTESGTFTPETPFVPVVCDTRYVLCDTKGASNNCSTPGDYFTMSDWAIDRQDTIWRDLIAVLESALLYPPIMQATSGLTSVFAEQSESGGLQFEPEKATAFNELSRSSTVGMHLVASWPQLAATGYWGGSTATIALTSSDDPNSICNQVIMESSTVTTIPVLPYLLSIIVSLLIVLVSYSGSFQFSRRQLFSSFSRLFNIWALHLPGQLHRELTEGLRTRRFKHTSTTDSWPTAPYQSGPNITRRGSEQFISGNTGRLENLPEENLPEDTEEHP